MPTSYNELVRKIQKHCPELMELSFGCEVSSKEKGTGILVVPSHMVGFGRECMVQFHGNIRSKKADEREFEILGHPIRLDHILRAVGACTGESEYSHFIGAGGYIIRFIDNKEKETTEHLAIYNLSKPFSEQGEELYEWLNTIIK